jgi:hypothetical protein
LSKRIHRRPSYVAEITALCRIPYCFHIAIAVIAVDKDRQVAYRHNVANTCSDLSEPSDRLFRILRRVGRCGEPCLPDGNNRRAGLIDVKGKGEMQMWFLIGRKVPALAQL